ncbi:MAG TPA: PQQ-binding-like beta-propeller repeat protein [Actinomycetota bacterium]
MASVITIAALATVGGAIRSLRADGAPPIQPDDVDELQADWVADLGSNAIVGLATDGAGVFVSTDEGLARLDPQCAGPASASPSSSQVETASASAPPDEPCAPTWQGVVHGAPLSAPVVFDDRVFAGSSSGIVYAFPTDCPTSRCEPEWVGEAGDVAVSQPAVNDDFVYVTSDRLYAFPSGCGTDDRVCAPVWSAEIPGRPSEGPPVIGGGLVVVTSSAAGGSVYAFPAVCSVRCDPVWAATTSGEPGGAALLGGSAYVAAGGRLLAFDLSCQGTCSPTWSGSFVTSGAVGPGAADAPSAQGDVVYVGADDGTLWVFPASCPESSCDPARSFDVAETALFRPSSQGGVIYLTSADGALHAVIDGCGASGTPCGQPWSVELEAPTVAAAVVGEGAVYAGDDEGHVYAFSLAAP